MKYRLEQWQYGMPMKDGVIETDSYAKARMVFLRSWDNLNYGLKVYVDGKKLNMRQTLRLFKPEGWSTFR